MYRPGMGIQITPALHPSEFGSDEAADLMVDLSRQNARMFFENVLEVPADEWTHGAGSIVPADVLLDQDALAVRAAMLDIVDTDHMIEGYWSLRLDEFLDVARWADRKGRDILWS